MKILLVAATRAELPLLQKQSGLEVKTLVTGVGMVASAFSLGQRLAQEHFDLVINCGIAGAIDRSFHPGEALVVSSDRFYRFGAEDGEQFLSVFDLNLLAPDVPPFKNGLLHGLGKDHFAATTHLREAEGITVQLVHGNAKSIKVLRESTPSAQVESMEGAAVFYAATNANIHCLQMRTISNYVETRNRASWDIPLALQVLHKQVAILIDSIAGIAL